MALSIRPVAVGPLSGNVSGRISLGYLYVTALPAFDPTNVLDSDTSGTSRRFYTSSSIATLSPVGYIYTFEPTNINKVDSLTLSQTIVVGVERPRSNADSLSLSHSISVTAIYNRNLSDSLSLSDVLHRIHEQSLSDTLSLSHTPLADLARTASDSLTLGHSLSVNIVSNQSVASTLALTATASTNAVRSISIADTLELDHANYADFFKKIFLSTTTWLCPPGITEVTVECWGGGGGGGASQATITGGGGGGGAYSKKLVSVTPGVTYTVTVGAGGTAGAIVSGGNGGDSWFSTSGTVLAKGGGGGTYGFNLGTPSYGQAGLRGLASDGVGTTKFNGGRGANGFLNGNAGSSGGTAADGIDGFPVAIAPAGAGAGGVATQPGVVPGGGGGAGVSNSPGRVGAAGKVVINFPSWIYRQPASDLSLTHVLSTQGLYSRTLADTLTVAHVLSRDTSSIFKQDTLALSHVLVMNIVKLCSVLDSLSLTHDVVPGAVTFAALSDSLTLSGTATSNLTFTRAISDTLTVTADLTRNIVKTFVISDSITLTADDTSRTIPRLDVHQEVPVSHTVAHRLLGVTHLVDALNLSQSLRSNPYYAVLSDVLTLSQTLFDNIVRTALVHDLSLTHDVVANIIRNISLTDTLALTSSAAKTAAAAISHDLSLTQVLERVTNDLRHSLSLTQSVSAQTSKSLSDVLTIAHAIIGNIVSNQSVSHTLTISHGVVGVTNSVSTCYYAPVSSVLPAAPTLTKSSTVTYTCGINSILINAPEIGDTEEMTFQRIVRESAGGTLTGFRQSSWPKSRVLTYTFKNFGCTQTKEDVQAFLRVSLGLQVTLLDYWGRTWVGVITNPDEAYQDISRSTSQITIKFQGVPQ